MKTLIFVLVVCSAQFAAAIQGARVSSERWHALLGSEPVARRLGAGSDSLRPLTDEARTPLAQVMSDLKLDPDAPLEDLQNNFGSQAVMAAVGAQKVGDQHGYHSDQFGAALQIVRAAAPFTHLMDGVTQKAFENKMSALNAAYDQAVPSLDAFAEQPVARAETADPVVRGAHTLPLRIPIQTVAPIGMVDVRPRMPVFTYGAFTNPSIGLLERSVAAVLASITGASATGLYEFISHYSTRGFDTETAALIAILGAGTVAGLGIAIVPGLWRWLRGLQ